MSSGQRERLAKGYGTTLNDFFEEVITFVVDDDEGGEILNFDLPHRFHAEFWILKDFDGTDAILSESGGGSTDRSKVETSVPLARVGDYL